MNKMKIRMNSPLIIGAAALLFAPAAGASNYKDDVFPIFKEKCVKCHMEGNDKGSVRLDLDLIEKEVGFTVKRGDPENSPLFDVITTTERDLLMPPPGKGTPLTTREKKIVEDWIKGGAVLGEGETVVAKTPEGEKEKPMEATGPAAVAEEWENNKGQKITATLLRVVGESVIFKIPDGREVPYPIENLSVESQAKVKAFAEESAPGAE